MAQEDQKRSEQCTVLPRYVNKSLEDKNCEATVFTLAPMVAKTQLTDLVKIMCCFFLLLAFAALTVVFPLSPDGAPVK